MGYGNLSGDVTGDQNNCQRGNHDQSMETRDQGTEAERTVIYCKSCGMEW